MHVQAVVRVLCRACSAAARVLHRTCSTAMYITVVRVTAVYVLNVIARVTLTCLSHVSKVVTHAPRQKLPYRLPCTTPHSMPVSFTHADNSCLKAATLRLPVLLARKPLVVIKESM
ncbi:hypothetical protein AMTR_s00027p00075060 [Amborella trichopoda]|uniref:Uncharacterized protein n=1 Tax=Amborella trichopoda TaxID=13333 RepID=W1PSQ3_AMBTC|nr:hypothetical protein AMTR_s00027p00075060 [Amborella trichopoda]